MLARYVRRIRFCSVGPKHSRRVAMICFYMCVVLFVWSKIWAMTNKADDIVSPADQELADRIRVELLHSWNAYRSYAWGSDELCPVTKSSLDSMGVALTMIDALDSLWMMKLDNEFQMARQWIDHNLFFNRSVQSVNLFELTIRVLGGLLSAFNLSKDEMFLTKAKLLGAHIAQAFGPNSIFPKPAISFDQTRRTWRPPYMFLAEIGSLQLELNELSRLTEDASYAHQGALILQHLIQLEKTDGMLPVTLEFPSGKPIKSSEITFGGRGDSYYEYLLKVWVQTGKRYSALKNEYLQAIEGLEHKLVKYSKPNNLLYVGQIVQGNVFSSQMDHLTCFLPGLLAYGVMHGMPRNHLSLAQNLLRTCYEMYNQTRTKLSPDIVVFSTSDAAVYDFSTKAADRRNLLRPELMESLFYVYQLTKDDQYKIWGWEIFQAFHKYGRLKTSGYAALADVTVQIPVHLDRMDSYWMAETLKYTYLLLLGHSPLVRPFGLDKWIYNTEGHLVSIHDSKSFLALVYDNIFFRKIPVPIHIWKNRIKQIVKITKLLL